MSTSKVLTQSMTGKWLNTIGKFLGFKYKTISYSLRYFSGNSLDQSVNISSALRNLVLDHALSSDTFQKHYLNWNVCAGLSVVHRKLNPQDALIRQATSHGGSRDSRRVFQLTDAQPEALKQNKEYVRLTGSLRTQPWAHDRPGARS
ncbi:hypothetical protein F4678DRAFT_460743 [Xylaria arbuscula]|nr:hypothetical protein F4678DRAFT_460743 [Xylaria arbuscula]